MAKNSTPFGLNGLGVMAADGVTCADLCGIEIAFSPELSSAELVCNDESEVRNIVKRWNFTFRIGSISFDGLEIMLGQTPINFQSPDGGDSYSIELEAPFIFPKGLTFVGRSLGDNNDDLHYRILNAQLNTIQFGGSAENFHIVSGGGTAETVDIVSHDVAIAMVKSALPEHLFPWFSMSAATPAETLADGAALVAANFVNTGSGDHVFDVVGSTPTLQLTQFNGGSAPAMLFDGIDDTARNEATSTNVPADTSRRVLTVALQMLAVAAVQHTIVHHTDETAGSTFSLTAHSASGWGIGRGTPNGHIDTGVVVDLEPHIVQAVIEPNRTALIIDNVLVWEQDEVTDNGVISNGKLALGSTTGYSLLTNALYAEVQMNFGLVEADYKTVADNMAERVGLILN